MAAKKTTRKRSSAAAPSLQTQAEVLQQKLGESAQQIWLAGVGAFGRAQSQGSRLFDTLVKEGSRVEQRAGSRASKVRDAIGGGVQGAKERATDAFERADQSIRTRVKGALQSLEVPTRRELGALIDRVDSLNSQLRQHNGKTAKPAGTATKKAAKQATKKAAPRKTAASKPLPAKKTAARKTVSKSPAKAAKTSATKRPAARRNSPA